jgi:hypothetical protein
MYTTVGTYHYFLMTVCCPGWIGTGQQTVNVCQQTPRRLASPEIPT